jgi:hypothetical protein
VVVFPASRRPDGKSTPGHIGVVVRAGPSGVEAVLHCSAGNFKATGDAIRETDDTVFRNRVGLIYAWCARLSLPRPVPETRRASPARAAPVLAKPVTLCVLATGADGEKIRRVAETVAASNPLGRRVVSRGDLSWPTEKTLAPGKKKVPSRGAAILSPDGTLVEVLGLASARRATSVDQAFNAAATSARGPRRSARRRSQRKKR